MYLRLLIILKSVPTAKNVGRTNFVYVFVIIRCKQLRVYHYAPHYMTLKH